VIEELRLAGLGVIEEAVLELGPGLTVLTGETGAGKTMVLTGLGLLFGNRGCLHDDAIGLCRPQSRVAKPDAAAHRGAAGGPGGLLGGLCDDSRSGSPGEQRRESGDDQAVHRSTARATPLPPPRHSVAMPRRPPVRRRA